MERRRARRFSLRIPVTFEWRDEQNMPCAGAGFSRDISISGLFVCIPSASPPLASQLDLTVLLPSLDPMGPGMRLRASGSIVRVQLTWEGAGLGIASTLGDPADPEHATLSWSENGTAIPCSYRA